MPSQFESISDRFVPETVEGRILRLEASITIRSYPNLEKTQIPLVQYFEKNRMSLKDHYIETVKQDPRLLNTRLEKVLQNTLWLPRICNNVGAIDKYWDYMIKDECVYQGDVEGKKRAKLLLGLGIQS